MISKARAAGRIAKRYWRRIARALLIFILVSECTAIVCFGSFAAILAFPVIIDILLVVVVFVYLVLIWLPEIHALMRGMYRAIKEEEEREIKMLAQAGDLSNPQAGGDLSEC